MNKLHIFRRPYLKIFLPIQFTYYIYKKKNKNNLSRLVINYRGLNNIIIPVYYPIPLINKLQNHLIRTKYITKINLKLEFYFVRIAEKEKWKTAFHYRYSLFEFRVIPISLINTPVIFYVTRYLQRSPVGSRAELGYREARARPRSGQRMCQSRATRIGLGEPLENRFKWLAMMRALAPLMTDPPR